MPPLISAIMPLYNSEGSVARTVSSVMQQSVGDFELIIVNDASTDSSLDIVMSFNDARIKILSHRDNKGAAAARNTGIEASRGRYIAFIDADDIWAPDKLKNQIQFMTENQSQACVTECKIKYFDQEAVGRVTFNESRTSLNTVVWGCFLSPGTTLILSRNLVDIVGMFDVNLKRLEDWDWLLRLSYTDNFIDIIHEDLATINVYPKEIKHTIIESLEYINNKHASTLLSYSHKTYYKFQSGILFERAACCWKQNEIYKAIGLVISAFIRSPINNYVFNRVVVPKLRRDSRRLFATFTRRLSSACKRSCLR